MKLLENFRTPKWEKSTEKITDTKNQRKQIEKECEGQYVLQHTFGAPLSENEWDSGVDTVDFACFGGVSRRIGR